MDFFKIYIIKTNACVTHVKLDSGGNGGTVTFIIFVGTCTLWKTPPESLIITRPYLGAFQFDVNLFISTFDVVGSVCFNPTGRCL